MHISPNNKRYIGITSIKPIYRWNNGKGYKDQVFYNAINKYGWDNFEHIIICKGLDKEEAEWLEEELIREFDTTNKDKGYNVTKGGDAFDGLYGELNGMYGLCGELSPNYGKTHTEEWKQDMSEKMSGENNPMFGKNPRDFMTEETKIEQSKKISEALKGREFSEEWKQKLSKAKSKAVICITTMEIFESRKVASETYHCDNSDIGKCCKGRKKSCGKLEDGTPLQWMNYIDYLELQDNNNNNRDVI